MGKIAVRPSVIVIKDRKVLCVRSKYKDEEYFLFPGGGPEKGETLEDCAIREVFEETNIKVRITKLLYTNDYIANREEDLRCLNIFFLGEIIEDREIHNDNDPCKHKGIIKDVVWIPLEDFEKIDFRPKELAKRLKKDFEKNFLDYPTYFVD